MRRVSNLESGSRILEPLMPASFGSTTRYCPKSLVWVCWQQVFESKTTCNRLFVNNLHTQNALKRNPLISALEASIRSQNAPKSAKNDHFAPAFRWPARTDFRGCETLKR